MKGERFYFVFVVCFCLFDCLKVQNKLPPNFKMHKIPIEIKKKEMNLRELEEKYPLLSFTHSLSSPTTSSTSSLSQSTIPMITSFLPSNLFNSLFFSGNYNNQNIGLLFGIQTSNQIIIQGICEVFYDHKDSLQLNSNIKTLLNHLSQISSLQIIGCIFPKNENKKLKQFYSSNLSLHQITRAMFLSQLSSNQTNFLILRLFFLFFFLFF